MNKKRYLTKDMVMDAAYEINKFPSVDAVPAVHGHWETVPNRDFDGFETVIDGEAEWCSNCKRASKEFKKWFKICPNCGAKMEAD